MKKVEERESLANNDNLRAFMGKYGIGVVMVFMLVLISILQPKFLNISNFSNILTQISINSLIAYGMCLAITTGGIDLTVGAQLALVSCVTGWAMVDKGMGVLEAVALGLCITTITGFVSGLLIAKFQMFPFVVTLSMQLVVRSLAQIVSNGKGKSMTDVAFKSIYTAKLFDVIPMPIIYLVLCVIVMYGLMHWTKLGRYIYSAGGKRKSRDCFRCKRILGKGHRLHHFRFPCRLRWHPLHGKDWLCTVQYRYRLRDRCDCSLRAGRHIVHGR